MPITYDHVIRSALVADGLGGEPYAADVAINGAQIAAVGQISGRGRSETDATGLLLTPGFVDIHTHYDGQAIWDNCFAPSSWHGVTTVVMGNCGVGFAPVHRHDRDALMELMEGVEDIPGVALQEGLDWAWESFSDYLQALERRPHDINFGTQLPHAALRLYVMGERAARLETATAEDMARMRALTRQAMQAGALGVSTSRSLNHKSVKGASTPSLCAGWEELTQIALGVQDAGRGVLQIIMDFDSPDMIDQEFAQMRRLVEVSGRPLSFSLMQKHGNPQGWRRLLDLVAQARADGLAISAQVAPRGVGIMLGLQGSRNVFSECPSYQRIAHLPLAGRVTALREPATRARILVEHLGSASTPLGKRLLEFNNIFAFGDPPEYDPGPERSIAALAVARGCTPSELAYEMLLERDGCAMLYSPFANYHGASLAACEAMISDPHTLIGLGDGGAHLGLVCDSSFSTYLLAHWRASFPLAWLVKRHTSDNARAIGLLDRGVIASGMQADLNLIDMARLAIAAPHLASDLPAGGRRLLQCASGYVTTWVRGVVVYREGQATGALPGQLVRGPQEAPTQSASV